MQTAQINSPRFDFPKATVPMAKTLDDFRVIHDNYASQGSFSAKAMRPVLIVALVAAVVAGGTIGLHRYTEKSSEAAAATATATAKVADPTVPAASSVQAPFTTRTPSTSSY